MCYVNKGEERCENDLELKKMKINLDKIVISPFSLREKMDEEHLNAIVESFKVDGQWDPIIVRPRPDGKYELISGEYRVRAALNIGWNEIEATVRDIDDLEASFLSLKTNLIRRSMEPIEESKAIKRYMDDFNLTQEQVAEKLGKHRTWVGQRLALVLKIIKEVQQALAKGKISPDHAVLISRLTVEKEGEIMPDTRKQKVFLDVILERKLSRDEAREVLKWIQNDTIYTIGYEGKNLDEFIKILEEKKIDVLLDIRESGKSRYKPEFNEDILEREFKKISILYDRRPELGVVYDVRMPYMEGWFSHDCFEQWYKWSVRGRREGGNVKDLIVELVKDLKAHGKVCLMCEETYSQPKGPQKHYCHRHFLAEMILEYEDPEEPLLKFEKRVDL